MLEHYKYVRQEGLKFHINIHKMIKLTNLIVDFLNKLDEKIHLNLGTKIGVINAYEDIKTYKSNADNEIELTFIFPEASDDVKKGLADVLNKTYHNILKEILPVLSRNYQHISFDIIEDHDYGNTLNVSMIGEEFIIELFEEGIEAIEDVDGDTLLLLLKEI